jgi:hypothetical protein
VIEASFRLSLNEQRAILFCISQANSINALLETDEFELSAKDLAWQSTKQMCLRM